MTVMVSVLSEPQRCNPCYQQYSHADTIVGCFDEQSINPDCKPKIHFAQTIFFFIVPVGTSNYCFFFFKYICERIQWKAVLSHWNMFLLWNDLVNWQGCTIKCNSLNWETNMVLAPLVISESNFKWKSTSWTESRAAFTLALGFIKIHKKIHGMKQSDSTSSLSLNAAP